MSIQKLETSVIIIGAGPAGAGASSPLPRTGSMGAGGGGFGGLLAPRAGAAPGFADSGAGGGASAAGERPLSVSVPGAVFALPALWRSPPAGAGSAVTAAAVAASAEWAQPVPSPVSRTRKKFITALWSGDGDGATALSRSSDA